ncbi:MAG TPA: TetR/AcrR family transcriptional regulator [Thiolapillus brandeum]|uniref:TetR/AcrR family transcriptional regulator n=1 Tax=Thiolapillus brandeum TaxID=1076588 RepID=A0A831WCG3_9GAMM|nr:TetR/AcrR family transcriptional regulator [Thiolapillus brandeum]
MTPHHPKHMPAEERRAVTVETVLELAAEQNPGEITTSVIAKRMGVTQGALFRYFPSKDALWQSVLESVAERLMKRIERAATSVESSLAALEAMFMAHVGFVTEHPGVPRLLFGELQKAEATPAKRRAQALIRRYGERLQELLERGKACGELDSTLDENAAATAFIGALQGLIMQSLLVGDVGHMCREAPGVFSLYRRGIGSGK